MKRLFLLAVTFVVVLGAALGTLLYVSLIPFFHEIGIAATVLLLIGLGCAGLLVINFTITQISVMWSHRQHAKLNSRLFTSGDVSAYLYPNGTWEHLSARHEMAKIPPPPLVIEAPKSEPRADKDAILEVYGTGQSIKETAKLLHTTEYEVRKIVNAEGVTRKKGE